MSVKALADIPTGTGNYPVIQRNMMGLYIAGGLFVVLLILIGLRKWGEWMQGGASLPDDEYDGDPFPD